MSLVLVKLHSNIPPLIAAVSISITSVSNAASLVYALVQGSGSSNDTQTASAGTASASDAGSDSVGSVVGRASASHGLLRAYSEAHAADNNQNQIVYVGSTASFSDDITINSPGLFGTNGQLTVSFTIDGSLSSEDIDPTRPLGDGQWSSARAEFELRKNSSIVTTATQSVTSHGLSLGTLFLNQVQTATIGFVYGTPFEMKLSIYSRSDARSDYGADTVGDLEHTATWGGFDSVKDSGGNVVPLFTASSTSGTDYTQAIPEPGSAMLFLLGLTTLGFRRTSRERQP